MQGEGSGFAFDGHAEEVDLLEVGAVVAGGLEAVEGELGRDVFCRKIASAKAGAAAFKEVVGEEANVCTDLFCVDGRFSGLDGGRDGRGLREERSGEEGQGEAEFHGVVSGGAF